MTGLLRCAGSSFDQYSSAASAAAAASAHIPYVAAVLLRHLHRVACSAPVVQPSVWKYGQNVIAVWKGGSRQYRAVVSGFNEDGTVVLLFEDGDYNTHTQLVH